MANSFMAGKLRIPDPVPKVEEKPTTKKKSETEKPWVGQASLRELDKRNADRKYVEDISPEVPHVPEVSKTQEVPHVPEVPTPTLQLRDLAAPQNEIPIAPVRDFHRVSNSINREALQGGMFTRPSCKQVYDALYLLTRGAIQPSRTVQIGRRQLLKKAGLGSDTTLDAALLSLQTVGLLKIEKVFGSQKGNIYEVLLPEEITKGTPGTSGTPSTYGTPSQKIPNVPKVESTYGTQSQTFENKHTYVDAKTLIKTKEEKRIDDEPAAAFQAFFEKINEVFKQLMGREAKQSDAEALAAIGELLAAEILEAAGRTKVVSDVAKFSLTHLRRRLGVRSIKVETSPEKETGKGATTTKPVKREIQLTDDEIQECPDCQGRLLIYPAGPRKGAVMCKHSELVKAKQAEAEKAEEKKVVK
ncbi:MAG TPA: hypothetical protein VF644_02400 [Pyrinomonadaceae bacterium]|jgi:hypothetical protein